MCHIHRHFQILFFENYIFLLFCTLWIPCILINHKVTDFNGGINVMVWKAELTTEIKIIRIRFLELYSSEILSIITEIYILKFLLSCKKSIKKKIKIQHKFIRKNVFFSLSFFTCIHLVLFRDYINCYSVVI